MSAQPPEPPSDQPADGGTPPPPPPPPPPSEPAYGAPAYGAPAYGGDPSHGNPPPGAPVSGAGTPGPLLDRFLARLIDGILLAIVNGFLVTFLIVGSLMGESGGFMYGTGANFAAAAVAAVVGVAIQMAYYVYMESTRGQTVGKMIMKLRTLSPTGGNPSVEEAARRNSFNAIGLLGIVPVLGIVGGLLSLVASIMIAVGINGDPVARQGWHDKFAGGTRVVKTG